MSTKKPAKKKPVARVDIHALLAGVELSSINFYELMGMIESEMASDLPEDLAPVQQLNTARRDDSRGFRVRVRSVLRVQGGFVSVGVSAEYELDGLTADAIDDDLMLEFVNEVSVMQIVPYIRQGIADLTQRIWGDSVLMPVLQRGDMRFTRQQKVNQETEVG